MARTNLLQKIRNQGKLAPMNNPALLHGLDRRLPFRRCLPHGKGARNIFPLEAALPIEKSRFGRENPRKSKEI